MHEALIDRELLGEFHRLTNIGAMVLSIEHGTGVHAESDPESGRMAERTPNIQSLHQYRVQDVLVYRPTGFPGPGVVGISPNLERPIHSFANCRAMRPLRPPRSRA